MTVCVRNSNKVILIIEFRQLGVKTGHFLTTRCLQKVLRDLFFKSGVCVVLFWFVCCCFSIYLLFFSFLFLHRLR